MSQSLRLVRRRSKFQAVASVVIVLYLAALIVSLAGNRNLNWDVVAQYIFSAHILQGLWTTLWLSGVTFSLAFVIGLLIALMRMSQSPLLRSLAWAYVWIFRSTPLLVQLLFWFNIAALYPTISLGLPFADRISGLASSMHIELGPLAWTFSSRQLVSIIMAAILALTLDCAAYASEVIRGGLLSVDHGQREAAYSLGVGRGTLMLRIVLPQAMRSIIPNAMNLLVNVIKGTTLVSVIAVQDLLYTAEIVYSRTFQVIPLLLVATIWYVVVCTLLSIGAYYVERRFARGAAGSPSRTLGQHLRSMLRGGQAIT